MFPRTPCVGVCSTTYGDLVCRGCKRFAHEIVDWNGYSEEQRRRVANRLTRLKRQSVRPWLRVADSEELARVAHALNLPPDQPAEILAYEILKRTRLAPRLIGLEIIDLPPKIPTVEVIHLIEDEFFQRSAAHYERSFRVLVR